MISSGREKRPSTYIVDWDWLRKIWMKSFTFKKNNKWDSLSYLSQLCRIDSIRKSRVSIILLKISPMKFFPLIYIFIYIYIKFVIWQLVYEGHKRMQLPIGVLKKTALGNNIYWYQGLNRCAFICHYRLFFTSFQKWWDKSIHISRKCMHIPKSLQAF